MEVSLDASQLAKPSYEVARPVFEQIVIMLTGITREELTQPVFTAMDAFEYPELHDESIAANNFFRQLCKLMSASGVKDFSWRAQLDQLVANTKMVEEEHAKNTNSLADAASQAKLDLAAAKQDTEALQDQVVQSPDKHRQAIAELAIAAEAKRTYCAHLSSQSIANDRKLEMVVKFDKEVCRCLKLLEELETVVARKKDVSQQVKDIKEGITANERVLAEASATGASLKQHQATVMDKIQRVEAQAALKLEAAAGYVEEAMKSKAAVEAEAAAIAAKAAEDEAAIRSMRELMQEMTANHEALTKGVMDKYALLRKAVGDYNKQLLIAMSESALASTALSTVMA
ncbi:DHR10 domain-containing protein [Haematococcus lacustris]|uniref:DHR10 domain-containing protein n=1 Tax=Haematococcus lacustris TaxID=44745 RepID=A0A699YA69_HAELA|nr:DHR10 domain-containing protein [Haematococcus lacustris]